MVGFPPSVPFPPLPDPSIIITSCNLATCGYVDNQEVCQGKRQKKAPDRIGADLGRGDPAGGGQGQGRLKRAA